MAVVDDNINFRVKFDEILLLGGSEMEPLTNLSGSTSLMSRRINDFPLLMVTLSDEYLFNDIVLHINKVETVGAFLLAEFEEIGKKTGVN